MGVINSGTLSKHKKSFMYDTKWEWIMPVVEAINEMTDEEDAFEYTFQIRPDRCSVFTTDGEAIVDNEHGSTNIEMVFWTAVAFCEWYNVNRLDV